MSGRDPDELIELYLAGELDEAGVREFETWLKADREHMRRYLREAMFRSDLGREVAAREERHNLGYPSERLPTLVDSRRMPVARKSRPFRRAALAAGLALAACLLMGVSLWMRDLYQPEAPSSVATLAGADGDVSIRRGAFVLPGASGATLVADDQVVLSGAGSAEVAFSDGTTLALGPGTTLGLVGDQAQKRFYLVGGSTTVRAARQPAERPLLIATAHAEVTVVGTVFTVAVDGDETHLSVSEGVVGLRDRASGERFRVVAGQRLDAGPAVASRTPARPAREADPRLGLELPSLGENGPELAFVDVFRQAGPWRPAGAGGALTLDPDGWIAQLAPGQVAETAMCSGLSGRYPKGTYVCLYDGQGELEAAGDATITSRAPGRLELSVDPGDRGIVLRLTSTVAGDPLRRIRVIMPDHEATYQQKPFHPDYLARWQGVAVLHAAAWAERRSGDQPYGWSERVRSGTGPRPVERGRPLEDLFDLADALRCDVWLQLPHQADDSYFSGMAQLAQRRLARGQRLYLEIGRDLWDGAWEPGKYAEARGRARGHTDFAGVRWYVDRSLELFAAMREVFGDDPRIVRVLCGAAGNPWINNELLAWRDAARHIDVLAMAAGVGGGIGDGLTPDQFLDLGRAEVADFLRASLAGAQELAERTAAEARAAGVRLIAVRTGVGIYPGKLAGAVTWRHHAHCGSFRNEPEVKSVLSEWLTVWTRASGDLVCVAPAMDCLRAVEAPLGTLPSANEVTSYQAMAPWLRRGAR